MHNKRAYIYLVGDGVAEVPMVGDPESRVSSSYGLQSDANAFHPLSIPQANLPLQRDAIGILQIWTFQKSSHPSSSFCAIATLE
jgi:hypothetical protein